ncbi:maleylacetoacetate isomerase [Amphritea japonica]|uniref:Maleylpyruvate isomerase n=1 Tax=Amphritea japonica ATCC BAA-1530 TaxID=1278309 RepID=A0A7R6SSW9_9GAMM|nr:maleylacetoacetate isomerase [Amphritea japonica]BBB26789.1 maleylpyruvate isomerase [Amphritea japonica ATCC BAA-1530]
MILYDYFRSSAAYRVRIALNLKKIAYTRVPVDLLQSEQRGRDYLLKNPQGLVPLLDDEGQLIQQSIAICEYLDEKVPEPSIIPADINERAIMRSIVGMIASDIHPVNNLRVLNYLSDDVGITVTQRNTWYRHWMLVGLESLEAFLGASDKTGDFCIGEQPTVADICLIPQLYNAQRFNIETDQLKVVNRIATNCKNISAFANAHPDQSM